MLVQGSGQLPRTQNPEPRANGLRYLVGGVNSPVRAFRQVGGTPLVLVRGRGAEVVDTQGTRFIDFISGWGCLLLGHNPPPVVGALRRSLTQGAAMGLTHPAEIELARRIVGAVPSVEQVRFTASGTEACMTAVKLARAVTGRTKLLTFDGCYHGHGDSLMAGKTAGLSNATRRETLSISYNDVGALKKTLASRGREMACVIIEPVAANMGVVVPDEGYLTRLRALTRQQGIVLIFDEVVTGFRLGPAGAQGRFGIRPDLTTFGKIIGGGLPIGALAGPKRLMQRLAPDGDVYHGGTFAGHPLSMTAGVAVLEAIEQQPPYDRLERMGALVADRLMETASRAGVPLQVNRAGSMLTVFFSDRPVRNFSDAKASRRDRFARWAVTLRERGILVPPSAFEALFLSIAHTEAHIDRLLRASAAAFRAIGAAP